VKRSGALNLMSRVSPFHLYLIFVKDLSILVLVVCGCDDEAVIKQNEH